MGWRKIGWRQVLLGLVGLLLALGLSACSGIADPEELYALPQPPADYRNLSTKIEEVLRETGGEPIAPMTGSNTQTVQLQDLDGDGEQECAVAFFRVPGSDRPLKIYIFRIQEDDSYELDTLIEEVGAAIYSVAYENVGGSAGKEIVVSWQISATDHNLGVYSTDDVEGIELLWVNSYSRFRLSDLDADGEKEVVVLTLASSEEEANRADYYDDDGAALALKSTAPLTVGVSEIKSIRGGNLMGGAPAVFITGTLPGERPAQVVDVLTYRDGAFSNVTINPETGCSDETVRYYTAVSGSDINGDGVTEIPQPSALPNFGGGDDFYILDWRQFNGDGVPNTVFTTYHNVTDGWYLILPNEWRDQFTITRKDSTTADERGVVFLRWDEARYSLSPFFTIYKLTGTNQSKLAELGDRQLLYSDSSATYVYETDPEVWDIKLGPEDVRERFRIIRTEWSTDN